MCFFCLLCCWKYRAHRVSLLSLHSKTLIPHFVLFCSIARSGGERRWEVGMGKQAPGTTSSISLWSPLQGNTRARTPSHHTLVDAPHVVPLQHTLLLGQRRRRRTVPVSGPAQVRQARRLLEHLVFCQQLLRRLVLRRPLPGRPVAGERRLPLRLPVLLVLPHRLRLLEGIPPEVAGRVGQRVQVLRRRRRQLPQLLVCLQRGAYPPQPLLRRRHVRHHRLPEPRHLWPHARQHAGRLQHHLRAGRRRTHLAHAVRAERRQQHLIFLRVLRGREPAASGPHAHTLLGPAHRHQQTRLRGPARLAPVGRARQRRRHPHEAARRRLAVVVHQRPPLPADAAVEGAAVLPRRQRLRQRH
eukprot:Rhum_TRINITY_DN14997_c8_g1::Rhum_TRINITY_DN14997_c8_g1_i1::g.131570::m.131570